MGPPPAADNFGQRQPITTAIKNICQYYPPNTCLRELLQNADDAGATEIEYVLDTKTYKDEPLLSEGLKGFQGPALLARNNSVFRDQDYDSLSSVGDSVKAHDPTSTGKFGQGFNAVYHWTDGPSIYSRNWLLILDPHEWWSRESQNPGGPRWDVVKYQGSIEIQNHLVTFNEFGLDRHSPLNQTIIRIPLRSSAQAAASKISQLEVELSDIRQALEEFSQEIEEGGLLFLKHIRKVIIRVGSDVVLNAAMLEGTKEDAQAREQIPTNIKDLYEARPPRSTEDISPKFELAIQYSKGVTTQIDHYLVQHLMLRSSGDSMLDGWARSQKLFPWVAVAALLRDDYQSNPGRGRLFTTLRLPMPTNLPVHIHGLFSIAPDRGRLSFVRGADDPPTKWNTFMFTHCASLAWLKLLVHRSAISWREELFAFWPRTNFSPVEMWDKLDDAIIDSIIGSNLKIWNTFNGCCVDLEHGLFAIENSEAMTYRPALTEAHVPIAYLDELMFRKTEQRANLLSKKFRKLESSSVRHILRSQGVPFLSHENASLVLEFCLLDAIKSDLEGSLRSTLYSDLQDISLWPTVSGTRSAPVKSGLLLPRNTAEMQLFMKSRSGKTLELSHLSPTVQKILHKDIENLKSIVQFRGLEDLAEDWPVMYPIPITPGRSEPWVSRPAEHDDMLHKIWSWICERVHEGQPMTSALLNKLYLIPINFCRIRRYRLDSESRPVLVIEPGEFLFKPLVNLVSQEPRTAPPLLDIEVLTSGAVDLLRNNKDLCCYVSCTNVDHAEAFAGWLAAAKPLLSQASEDVKRNLLDHLEKITKGSNLPTGMSSVLVAYLRALPLYSKTSWPPPYDKCHVSRCALDGHDHLYETPSHLPLLPEIPKVSFFASANQAESAVVRRLKVLENVSARSLISRHFIAWIDMLDKHSAKEDLIEWLMAKALPFSEAWQNNIFSKPIIPLPLQDTERKYRPIDGMVDPTSELACLFDPKETVFPCPDFFTKHEKTLRMYGMLSKPRAFTPLERVRYFSKREGGPEVHKAERLMRLPVLPELENSEASIAEIRNLKWLPGRSLTGQSVLFAPNECRGADESHLVDLVLGTVAFTVSSTNWKRILGWDTCVDAATLLKQLDGCLLKKDHPKVDAVLLAIHTDDYPALKSRRCILGRSGDYFMPGASFLPRSLLNSRPLAPYLDEVDAQFAIKHGNLLKKLEIQSEPSSHDLLGVQSALVDPLEGQLDPSGVALSVTVLAIATSLQRDPADLLVPDTSSKLRKVADIVYGEPLSVSDRLGFKFTHPEVSADLAHRLGIENSWARAIRLEVDLWNDDQDDFTPSESYETSISDTLERYPVTATFNEFLTNADDAGATKITWILDECTEGYHPSDSLLTAELQSLQGPALFVHNDGLFSERDFAGFKDIGQGGKKSDVHSTGMFGRGVLSMYHFTDVPSVISNDSFLILDPQQRLLPVDHTRRQRRVGTKLPISSVHSMVPDQLSPFAGLCGFDPTSTQYRGTIFRLPLRLPGAKSRLKDSLSLMDLTAVKLLLDDYLSTARIALLFLRHITSIKFQFRGRRNYQWSVGVERTQLISTQHFQHIRITICREGFVRREDSWCVGMKPLNQIPAQITRSGKGSTKVAECGIAALLIRNKKVDPQSNDTKELGLRPSLRHWVFCRSPTCHESLLPVSFHASFALTGDRRFIALEKHADNSAWNRWLLENCLSTLYLELVQLLAYRLGQAAFDYWPSTSSSLKSDSPSEVLSNAFWHTLLDQKLALSGILPLAIQNDSVREISNPNFLDSSYQTTDLNTARFDFLRSEVSQSLQPLSVQLITCLVRPPKKLWPNFKTEDFTSQIKEIDQRYLCNAFKVEDNCKRLEAFVAELGDNDKKCTTLALLLRILIPHRPSEDMGDWDLLDGCRILPRPSLSDPLGTLAFRSDSTMAWHLVMSLEEQVLFAFAADTIVNSKLFSNHKEMTSDGVHYDPIKRLLEAPLNVRRMGIDDVGSLLAKDNSPSKVFKASDKFQTIDDWMLRFWQYINLKLRAIYDVADHSATSCDETVRMLLSEAGLFDHNVYRVCSGSASRYITPREFETLPCVLQPVMEERRKICQQVPGLCLVDSTYVPFLLQQKEGDLNDAASFARLLGAFRKLEKTSAITAKKIIGESLNLESRNIMHCLAMDHLAFGSSSNPAHYEILRQLPLWRRMKRSVLQPYEHIAAEDAFFFRDRSMLEPCVSWATELVRFVDPHDIGTHPAEIFQKLGVRFLDRDEVWQKIKADLPYKLETNESRQQYAELLRYLHRWTVELSGKIAPNGNGDMCECSTLYDHTDQIFQAAFRGQESTCFLHGGVRSSDLRAIWLSLGLRARTDGAMGGEDFLECVSAINRRWHPAITTEVFESDAGTIASYLKYDGIYLRSWPISCWATIAKVPMFRIRDAPDTEPSYRLIRMRSIAQQKSHRALEDSSHTEHMRIIWSQTSFLKDPPTDFVYQRLPRRGKPAAAQVFEQLLYLAGMINDLADQDLPEFLRDVQACYTYLQEDVNATKSIPGIHEARVWINIDTTQVELVLKQDLEGCLTTTKFICLNLPADSLPIMYARKFLVPYEKLLVGMGCRTVIRPSATLPQTSDSRELSLASAMAEMRHLRDQNLLVDIVFEAGGAKKPAHRIVLAAVSDYCKAQFAGEWGRLLGSQVSIRLKDIKFLTLSQMIDFAYTGDFDWPELKDSNDAEEIAKTLEMLLDLLQATDMWLLQRLHDMTENFLTAEPYSAIYIRPDTVEWVRERGESARAEGLVRYCDEFITKNEELVVSFRE